MSEIDIVLGSEPLIGSCSSNAVPRVANASRVFCRVARREHQRAVGVLGDADDPRDVDAAVGERLSRRGRATRAVVELDGEPDRHAEPPARPWYAGGTLPCAPMTSVASGRYAGRLSAGAARQDPDEEDAATSRCSAWRTRNATRAALRFFRERRIVVHYVDLRKKPIARRRAAPVRRPARRARR